MRAVRRDEHAVPPAFARHAVLRAQGLVRVVADVPDELVVLVEDRDASGQIGHGEVAVALLHAARQAEHAFDDRERPPLEVEDLQAVVAAVGDQQRLRRATLVDE